MAELTHDSPSNLWGGGRSGGGGLSGTCPKAGGPRYLGRFATERVRSTGTTASGGNAALMSVEG